MELSGCVIKKISLVCNSHHFAQCNAVVVCVIFYVDNAWYTQMWSYRSCDGRKSTRSWHGQSWAAQTEISCHTCRTEPRLLLKWFMFGLVNIGIVCLCFRNSQWRFNNKIWSTWVLSSFFLYHQLECQHIPPTWNNQFIFFYILGRIGYHCTYARVSLHLESETKLWMKEGIGQRIPLQHLVESLLS